MALAKAAMPSPRPVKPIFSLVVALTATRDTGSPAISAMRARMASRCGPMRGASHTMVMSRCDIRPPRARTSSTANARNRSEEAPRHCGSLGGKWTPISPSEMAPEKRVDQGVKHHVRVGMSRQTTAEGHPNAAKHDVIAIAELVDVEAETGANVAKLCEFRGFGAGEILVRGEFHVGGFPLECDDLDPGPFGKRRIIGEIVPAGRRGAPVRIQDAFERKGLRCLHEAQPGPVESTGNGSAGVHGLDGVCHGNRRNCGASFRRRLNCTRDERRMRQTGVPHRGPAPRPGPSRPRPPARRGPRLVASSRRAPADTIRGHWSRPRTMRHRPDESLAGPAIFPHAGRMPRCSAGSPARQKCGDIALEYRRRHAIRGRLPPQWLRLDLA